MSIDYERQFKELDFLEYAKVREGWTRERCYGDAKSAYLSAKRSEARGVSVALAKVANYGSDYTNYYVWVGEKP